MGQAMYGPAGGIGGTWFDGYDLPVDAELVEIHLLTDQYVNALQFVYRNATGERVVLPTVGAEHGQHAVFVLEPGERLTGISGLADWYIDAIRFHTNRRVSELYGGHGTSQAFSYELPSGEEVAGLFGRFDRHIDAIGVTARPTNGVAASTKTAPQTERTPRAKDLEKVEGIGPKIAQLLIEAGIYDLTDLSQTPVARIQEVLHAAGPRYALANPETWPEQAALGARGDWDGMIALQSRLTAGRAE
jgi:predicted flap endonuclease-1-like 5' DNA nuclease